MAKQQATVQLNVKTDKAEQNLSQVNKKTESVKGNLDGVKNAADSATGGMISGFTGARIGKKFNWWIWWIKSSYSLNWYRCFSISYNFINTSL